MKMPPAVHWPGAKGENMPDPARIIETGRPAPRPYCAPDIGIEEYDNVPSMPPQELLDMIEEMQMDGHYVSDHLLRVAEELREIVERDERLNDWGLTDGDKRCP